MPYKRPIRPYVYIQQPVAPDAHRSNAISKPHLVFCTDLENAEEHLKADREVGLTQGVIYVRASRAMDWLKSTLRLQDRVEKLNAEIDRLEAELERIYAQGHLTD